MKTCFESLRKSGWAFIVAVLICFNCGVIVFAQSNGPDAVPVLEGLDPVMLVQGKEVQGNLKITVTRGNFEYMFASETNKATFEKDPARYEIQLNGACARMGPLVNGNPDLYTVYKGRIYIFGSGDCKTRFEAAPAKYLESEGGAPPKIALTPEALNKGQALIEKAVTAMGGPTLIDSLANFQEKSTTTQSRQQGDIEVKSDLVILFPDRIRLDQVQPDYMNPTVMRQGGIVITQGEAVAFGSNGIRPLPDAFRVNQEREINQRPLTILRARKNATFKAAATGTATVGETVVEQVAAVIGDANYTLGIDPASGRILSLAYRRRGPGGDYGQLVKVFSDFRKVGGVTLPFKVTATFNDQPWKEQSSNIESISVNGKIDPALFEKPTTARTP